MLLLHRGSIHRLLTQVAYRNARKGIRRVRGLLPIIPDLLFALGGPGLQLELERLGVADEQRRVIVRGWINLLAGGVALLADVGGPCHAANADQELGLNQILALADAPPVPERGEAADGRVFCERLPVGRVTGVEPAIGIESSCVRENGGITRDSPEQISFGVGDG